MSPIISRVASPGGAGGSSFLRTYRNRRFIIKPIMLAPGNGSTGIVRKPTLIVSTYSVVGSVGSHLSSDWQVSTNSTFTNIVQQSLSDTSNKTSFTLPSDLSLNTLYYGRVRYTDGVYVSEWSDSISFTTTQFLPYFSNGTQTVTSEQSWVVPSGIGRLRVRFYSNYAFAQNGSRHSGHATSEYEFDVVPGETLRLSPVMIGIPDAGGPVRTQACCFVAQGQWGGTGGESGYDDAWNWSGEVNGLCGGRPGTPNGGTASRTSGTSNATGGTTSADGVAGQPNEPVYDNGPGNFYNPAGGPLGRRASDPYNYYAGGGKGMTDGSITRYNGSGGFGWFGGGAGVLARGAGQSGGGGGSSYNNIPSGRNPTTNQSSTFVAGFPSGDTNSGQNSAIRNAKCILTW